MALGEFCVLDNRANLVLASLFYPRRNDFQIKNFGDSLFKIGL